MVIETVKELPQLGRFAVRDMGINDCRRDVHRHSGKTNEIIFLGENNMQKARIRLTGTDFNKVEMVCDRIREIAERTGVNLAGPIPAPDKTAGCTDPQEP